MANFSLPSDKGEYIQSNKGDSQGNIYMTYGVDLNEGKIAVSPQVKKLINDTDDAQFNGYASAIGMYRGSGTQKIIAVSGKAFSADDDTPLGTWAEETTGSTPSAGNSISDGVYFDGLFLVAEATNIKSWNGTLWASWWTGTLGKSALTSGTRHNMWVGSDGNLYIVDLGNKVYRVTPTGTATTTGNGTLDLSATQYRISCGVSTSSRSWIGTIDLHDNEAVILEWDMSPSATTANKFHKVGAKGVYCIAIWNDTPIAILSNGKAKYFNGVSFVDFDKKSIQFPITDGYELKADDDFLHPNGWAIIDDMPHFLVAGRVDATTTLGDSREASYRIPAGVWCLDPSIGLYNRFPIGTGLTTQEDYGKMRVSNVGALYSLQSSDSKFLASFEYLDDTEATKSTLVYHDANNTQPSRGYIMTSFVFGFREALKKVEMYHEKLASGEKIRVYSRNEKDEVIGKAGIWNSTTDIHISETGLEIVTGDVAFVKMGSGSGMLLRVESVVETASVTVVTFTEPNTFVVAGDKGTLDFLNFRYMGEVTNTTTDYHTLSIPEQSGRKRQFLFEFQQNAGSTMEIDYILATS